MARSAEIQKSFKSLRLPLGAPDGMLLKIWGSEWDNLFAKDTSGALLNRVEEVVDGDLLKYVVEGGAYMREHFFGKNPELKDLVKDLSDEELEQRKLGVTIRLKCTQPIKKQPLTRISNRHFSKNN